MVQWQVVQAGIEAWYVVADTMAGPDCFWSHCHEVLAVHAVCHAAILCCAALPHCMFGGKHVH